MSSEFIYCMECGARLPAEARFCNVCGTRVLRSESSDAPSWQPEASPVSEEEWPDTQPTDRERETSDALEIAEGNSPGPVMTEPPAADDESMLEEPEQKWVWGERPPETSAEATSAADDETAEMRPPAAAIDQGEEIVETRRYPPREEVRREDLDDFQRRQHETREVEAPYYEEDGLGIRPGILMATIGFAIALAGVFFPWVSLEGTDVNALDDSITAQIAGREVEGTFEFQVQDALDNDERLDAYLVIGLSAAGIFFLFLEYVLFRRLPIGRVYAALGGLAVGALGVVELLYIRDVVPDEVSFSYEPGLFMVTIGGAMAIVGSLIPVGSADD